MLSPARTAWTRAPEWLLGAAVALVLAVALVPVFFAHPLGDDLCNAVRVRDHGFAGAWVREYLEWGGRWAGTLVTCGFPALLDPVDGYAAALLVAQAVAFGALFYLLRALFLGASAGRRALALTALLYALYWAGMPHPGQTFYWLEGAIVYSLNVSGGFLLLGWLLRAPEARPGGARLALAAVAALLVGAFHELFALAFGAMGAAGAAVAWRARDPRARLWATLPVGSALALASIVLAPGNEARVAIVSPEPSGLGRSLALTALMWVRVLDVPVFRDGPMGRLAPLGWVADPKLLAATLVVAAWPGLERLRSGLREVDLRLLRLLVAALVVAILSGAFFAGAFAAGRPLPLRALNGLYWIFLLGWLASAVLWLRGAEAALRSGALRTGAHLLLALGLLASTNLKLSVRDIATGRLAAFDRKMGARYAEAREAGADAVLEVAPLRPWPSSYFQADLPEIDPALRACWAGWFGVAGVSIPDSAGAEGGSRGE